MRPVSARGFAAAHTLALIAGSLLVASCLFGCARPEDRKTSLAAKTAGSGEAIFEGVPPAGLLSAAVEVDVPGELAMRVPGDWIAQRQHAPGHAMFVSRDGQTVVTVTEMAPALLSDESVLRWAAQPWTKVSKPTASAYRPIKLGRSVLPAEQASGTALLDGKPARASYVRLRRSTDKGAVSVLVMTFVRDDAPPEDRAKAEAVVRSLGTL